MALEQQSVSQLTIISSFLNKGFMAASLSDWTTSALSVIEAGSCVEVGGVCFYTGTTVTPNASSWTAISSASSAYLCLTPSGTAPTMILSAAWSSTAPTWVASKNGWYASAGSGVRVIGSVYKTSATKQEAKTLYITGRKMPYITFDIGDWQMPLVDYKYVPNSSSPGVPINQIRRINVIIRDDDGKTYPFDMLRSTSSPGGWWDIESTGIRLYIYPGGFFTSADFMATSYNRGWVTIDYEM